MGGGWLEGIRVSTLCKSEFTDHGQYLKVGGVFYNMENGLPVSNEEAVSLKYQAFTRDGTYCIDGAYIKDAHTGQVVYRSSDHAPPPTCFTADDKGIAIGGHAIFVIDWKNLRVDGEYTLPPDVIATFLYKRLAVRFELSASGPNVSLYKTDFNKLERTLISSTVNSGSILDCSFDARKVLLKTHQLEVVDAETGVRVAIPGLTNPSYIPHTSFSSDGVYILVWQSENPGRDCTSAVLKIYNTDTGKLHADITSQSRFCNATFIGDDTKITTIHEDNRIGLWDFVKGELIKYEYLRAV